MFVIEVQKSACVLVSQLSNLGQRTVDINIGASVTVHSFHFLDT
jgi:hypothetical protein